MPGKIMAMRILDKMRDMILNKVPNKRTHKESCQVLNNKIVDSSNRHNKIFTTVIHKTPLSQDLIIDRSKVDIIKTEADIIDPNKADTIRIVADITDHNRVGTTDHKAAIIKTEAVTTDLRADITKIVHNKVGTIDPNRADTTVHKVDIIKTEAVTIDLRVDITDHKGDIIRIVHNKVVIIDLNKVDTTDRKAEDMVTDLKEGDLTDLRADLTEDPKDQIKVRL